MPKQKIVQMGDYIFIKIRNATLLLDRVRDEVELNVVIVFVGIGSGVEVEDGYVVGSGVGVVSDEFGIGDEVEGSLGGIVGALFEKQCLVFCPPRCSLWSQCR